MAVLGQLGLYYSQADMQDKYIHKLQLASIALTPSIPQVHKEVEGKKKGIQSIGPVSAPPH